MQGKCFVSFVVGCLGCLHCQSLEVRFCHPSVLADRGLT